MVANVLMSHKSDEWSTPQDFYDRLDKEFHFTLDPCATDENHKTGKYYTLADNGLNQPWGGTSCSVTRRTAISAHGCPRQHTRRRRMA